MEKLPMCRICLVEDVRMFIVVNRNLHELYEKLTDIPFLTEDSRPILACFFCCTKLKQCYRFLRQCLAAEELFAQRMNEDYEPYSLINQDHPGFLSGFVKSPIEQISIIIDEHQTESIAIKEELPAASEILDDIIEPIEECKSEELEPENLETSCLDVADAPAHHSESDLEDYYVPLKVLKTEVVEEQEVSKKKQRASQTERATVAKKPKPDTRRTSIEGAITAEQTKTDKSDSKAIQTTQIRTSKPGAYCNEPFTHTRTQIGEKLKCDVCRRSFSKKPSLLNHILIHTGEKPYKCAVCQRRFRQKGCLTRHSRIHTGEMPYKCDVCQHSFYKKRHFTKHIRIHTGENPYKCDVCHRSFSHKWRLTSHSHRHTGEKPYKCDVCHRSFSLKCNLTSHIHRHTGEKPYKCDVCHRSFSEKSTLSGHIRTHTGEKPYKCDICQRSFSCNSYLTKHILIHTGEKPYKCDLCQRRFRAKSTLSSHIRTHTGEKPYKCDICQRSYSSNRYLTKHIRIHTGEKP